MSIELMIKAILVIEIVSVSKILLVGSRIISFYAYADGFREARFNQKTTW